MSEYILGIIITSAVTIVTVILNGQATRNKLTAEMNTNQEVMKNELKTITAQVGELKEDVKKHNTFGIEIAKLDTRVGLLEKRVQ